jgi:hypothetical protein
MRSKELLTVLFTAKILDQDLRVTDTLLLNGDDRVQVFHDLVEEPCLLCELSLLGVAQGSEGLLVEVGFLYECRR